MRRLPPKRWVAGFFLPADLDTWDSIRRITLIHSGTLTTRYRKRHIIDWTPLMYFFTPPQLSIYPSPEPEILLEETSTPLEKQIGTVRVHVTHMYNKSGEQLGDVVSSWIGVEQKVERELVVCIGIFEAALLWYSMLFRDPYRCDEIGT